MNTINETIPTISGAMNCTLLHPASPTELKLYNSPPNPNVDKITDGVSNFGCEVSVTFFNKKIEAIIIIIAIGNTT